MDTRKLRCAVEVRETDDGPRLIGTIVQEGRAAENSRAELFTPGSIAWPEDGIAIKTRHYGPTEVRAVPVRQQDGSINVEVRATPAMVEAVQSGRDGLSVEFVSLREHRTSAGVREIRRALIDGAALTDKPEYAQGVAELREKRSRQIWL